MSLRSRKGPGAGRDGRSVAHAGDFRRRVGGICPRERNSSGHAGGQDTRCRYCRHCSKLDFPTSFERRVSSGELRPKARKHESSPIRRLTMGPCALFARQATSRGLIRRLGDDRAAEVSYRAEPHLPRRHKARPAAKAWRSSVDWPGVPSHTASRSRGPARPCHHARAYGVHPTHRLGDAHAFRHGHPFWPCALASKTPAQQGVHLQSRVQDQFRMQALRPVQGRKAGRPMRSANPP